jgi:hypothetical protein
MWYYLYRTDTGALVSETSVAPDPVPDGLGVHEREERASGMAWDPEAREFVTMPATREPIPRGSFLLRFTPAEQVALDVAAGTRGSPASLLEKWVAYSNGGVIETDNPALRMLVMGLEATGVIGSGRALEVLDGE